MKLSGPLEHITMQGSVSQIFNFWTSFDVMAKKREDLGHFFKNDFLHFIQFELRHKINNLRHTSLHIDLRYIT